MSDIREIEKQLDPLQVEYVNTLGKMLKGSSFFSKVGVIQDEATAEIKIFAVPKVLYKDMVQGMTQEQLKEYAFQTPIPPAADLMNEAPLIKATAAFSAFLAHYIKGGREVALNNVKSPTPLV